MSELREYTYEQNGISTTAMLTEEDAKRLGATPTGTGGTGDQGDGDGTPGAKSAHPSDKSRATDNKDR